jgi:hypothetical protein
MKNKMFNRLLAFSLFFLAHWFFGNLYEEIVLAPNQLTNAYEALKSWQGYFTITNQIYYYVPFTQIAVFVICFLYFKSDNKIEKALLKKASIYGLLSIAITVLIVTQLNLKLFFGDVDKYKQEIFSLSVIWLIGNAIRLYLVGNSLYFTFKTYILRQNSNAENNN